MLQIISGFIGNLILMVGILLFGKIVLSENIKISKKKLLAYILLSSLIHSVILMTLTGTIKTILMAIINIIYIIILFKISIKKAVFIIFIYMFLLVILELGMLFIVSNILNISKNFSDSFYAGSIILNLIISILAITIAHLLKTILRGFIDDRVNKKIVILSIMTFISILM